MQFKKCFFAKLIYNLQVWSMEPMKICHGEVQKKSSQGRNEKIITDKK
jgi:hypothetical protein